ncbi:LppP/LprE family lipoprotein [Corynebacterium sp. H130]|uniref:LppP/LprE family lipoprotein n=1 Tax=Corynebacterium sp. H130 TaxID=3133444 RepID=UPI0030B41F4D
MTRTIRRFAIGLAALIPLGLASPAQAFTLPDLSSGIIPSPQPPAPIGNIPSPVDNDPNCGVGFEDGFATYIEQIAPPSDFTRWEFTGETNFNPCRDLSYAELREVTKATPGKKQYLLFHRGQFIGTTLERGYDFQTVRVADDSSLTIDYHYWKNNDADPGKYAGALTFRWDGEKVATEGTLPDDFLAGAQSPQRPPLSSW